MKKKLFSVLGVSCLSFLLAGCASYGGCGGYACPDYNDYNHDSVCGQYSCTDNSELDYYANDCLGPYRCGVGQE